MDLPPTAKDTRVAWILRWGLYLSAASFAASVAILMISITFMNRPPPNWISHHAGLSMLGALLFGVGRFVHVVFFQLQAPLSEWIVTFLFVAAVMALLKSMSWWEDLPSGGADRAVVAMLSMFVVSAGGILGSAWGWKVARSLQENRARARLKLMALGWLLVIGLGGGTLFGFMLIAILVSLVSSVRIALEEVFWTLFTWFGFSMCLAYPALSIERQIRRASKEEECGGTRSAAGKDHFLE